MQFGACRANERDLGELLPEKGGSEVPTCKQNLLSARKLGVSASKWHVGASKPIFIATKNGVSASKLELTTNK
ncbi:hypothetical protein JSQ81_14905 [Sporosarcina sp. Marseille-Q4063]|uniref:hypothetical protein n=1 Tax=Sporosarcina sp. Marseille-Q4063 TaxID=2810514 RepID=UPI001BAFA4F8|nr:hypothetical protein [Sporosarcina sp. Marseille-Q4063]QUW21089.1 hypothetical protein JSQ81_14905 [Sporosarcina sp. Marseille-Q4063]